MKNLFPIFIIFLISTGSSFGQEEPDSVKHPYNPSCEQQALGDWIRQLRHKEEKTKPPQTFSALVLPNISSNPTNGFVLGVGGGLGWLMGPKENTSVSSAPFTVAITSKSQMISFIKPNIYTKENRFFLQGDYRFYIYSQPTYGLGTNSPDTSKVPPGISWMGEGAGGDSVLFPMRFNYVKFHQIVNKQLIGELYAGIGYHLDYYYSIEDEYYHPQTDSTDELLTPHHYYTLKNDFSTENYMLSGLSLNVVYDTRDNQINPYKGIYATINYRINPTWLGSDKNSSSLWLEFRTYVRLSKKTPRHLVGFWIFGDFNLSGTMPYLTLPYLGEDQRARSGRGYTNGRYRGDKMVYGEVEYRFPISQCSKIVGGVVFVNAVTASNPNTGEDLFKYIRPAVGFGIRVMVNKYFRTNINLDFAIGSQGKGQPSSRGFYFSGQETF